MRSALQLPDIQGWHSEYRDGRDKPSIKGQLLRKPTSKHRRSSPFCPNTVLSPAVLGRFWITCSILLSGPLPYSPAPSHRLTHPWCSYSKCLLQPLQEVAWPSSHLSLPPLTWKLLWHSAPEPRPSALFRCSAEACWNLVSAASLHPAWQQKASLSFSVSIFCVRDEVAIVHLADWNYQDYFIPKHVFRCAGCKRTHYLKGPDEYISNKYTYKSSKNHPDHLITFKSVKSLWLWGIFDSCYHFLE